MERALEEEGKVEGQDFIIVEQTPKGLKDKKINSKIAGFSGVTLYKIHGSFIRQLPTPFADPAPSGLILTEEDYIQFLTLLTQELKVSANTINFRIKESTLLFLGYGLQDWDFRVLYKSLIEGLQDNERETSYAVQKNPDPVWVNYWNKKQVQIKDMDLYAFAMQLEQWYNNTQP
jgi:hypothetical protein